MTEQVKQAQPISPLLLSPYLLLPLRSLEQARKDIKETRHATKD